MDEAPHDELADVAEEDEDHEGESGANDDPVVGAGGAVLDLCPTAASQVDSRGEEQEGAGCPAELQSANQSLDLFECIHLCLELFLDYDTDL